MAKKKAVCYILDEHIYKCIVSSLSLHKVLTRCEDQLPWSLKLVLHPCFDRCGFSLLFEPLYVM